jgi:hypothetical protein
VAWTVWVAVWTTPLTAETTGAVTEFDGVPGAPVATAAGALADGALAGDVLAGGALAAGALAGGALDAEAAGGGVAGAPVALAAVWLAEDVAAAVGDEAVDETVGVTGAATVDTGEDGAGEAEEGAPGTVGSCAADAGRAKITARIMASTKIAARPLQAHTQTRRDQAPTSSDSPNRRRMGAFPSTARKLRQTLCYRAINLTM